MFPLTSNEAYIKPTGERSTLGAELGGSSYTLPTAGADTKGGVKIGTGLKMTGEVLSADQVPAHTIAEAGKVLTVADDGTLEWDTKGSGGGDAFLSYDFTKYGERTINGVSFSSSGAEFTTDTAVINTNINFVNITVYLDVDSLNIVGSNNKRLLMGTSSNGFVYRNTGYWGLYSNNWYMSEISDPEFFDHSKIKIYIDNSMKWHIYKNNVLVFEPDVALNIGNLTIGSSDSAATSINGAILTGARIYTGNYTE